MALGDIRLAFVHDELTRRGGAEVVLEELLRIFPKADVYALYAGQQPRLVVDGRTYHIRTSFLQRWPLWFRRHPSRLLPFLAQAAEQIDLSHYDVVLSSASGLAKAIVTRAHVPHLCYCHTPTRYLWELPQDVNAPPIPRLLRWPGRALLHYLRLADFTAAQRVDHFIANSNYTAERIRKYYRRESVVVYPPIDTSYFTPRAGRQPKERSASAFLCVGRLTPSKRFDQAIAACEKMRLPLRIAGVGSDRARLKKLAGRYTTLVGRVSPAQLRELYRTSRALLQPGTEDFGMAAVEAHACGLPVVAYAEGGIREIVRPTETGWLYHTPRVEALSEAMRQFITHENDFLAEVLQQQALTFSRAQFQTRMQYLVRQALAAPAQPAVLKRTAAAFAPAKAMVY